MTKFTNFKITFAHIYNYIFSSFFTILFYILQYFYIILIVYNLFLYSIGLITSVIYCDDGTTIHSPSSWSPSVQVEASEDSETDASKISNLYYNIKNRARRRLFWELCEAEKGNYNSYKEYKKHWNKDINITKEVKKDLATDLNKLKVVKHTVAWIFNRRKS